MVLETVTIPAFQFFQKDAIPILKQNKMVYKFQCQCDADYIGKTIQRLEVRVKPHVPRELLRYPQNATSKSSQLQELAIADQLADHNICRDKYTDDCFSVLCKARSKQHLAFSEAIAITLYCPTLCRQRRQFDILCLVNCGR